MIASLMGRFTPLQADVLSLGGVVCGVPDDLITIEDRLTNMRKALIALQRRTQQDFGYEIFQWHAFLLGSEIHRAEYTHESGWRAIERFVPRLVTDSDRLRFVEQLLSTS